MRGEGVDRLSGLDPALPLERQRALVQRTGVVAVVMREDHPADILRVDEIEDLVEPEMAVHGGARVDDHRFRPHG